MKQIYDFVDMFHKKCCSAAEKRTKNRHYYLSAAVGLFVGFLLAHFFLGPLIFG